MVSKAQVHEAVQHNRHVEGELLEEIAKQAREAESRIMQHVFKTSLHRRALDYEADDHNTLPLLGEFRLEFHGGSQDDPANWSLVRFHLLDEYPHPVTLEPVYFLRRLPVLEKKLGLRHEQV